MAERAFALQDRYVDLLLVKVEEVRYPSKQIMDRIEQTVMSDEQLADYIEVLLEKVEDDKFPSLQMLDRVRGLLDVAVR